MSHQQWLEIKGKCLYCYRIGWDSDYEGQKCWEHIGVYDLIERESDNHAKVVTCKKRHQF